MKPNYAWQLEKGRKQKDLDSTPSWCLVRAFLGKAVSSPMQAAVTNTTDGVAYRQEEFRSHSLRSGCHSVVSLVRAVLLDQPPSPCVLTQQKG